MNTYKTISFIGGDKRQKYMKEFFENKGYNVYSFANAENKMIDTEILEDSEIIIFPLPVCDKENNINSESDLKYKAVDFLKTINKDSIIFGGKFNNEIEKIIQDNGMKYYDYYQRDEITIKNVIPTVQGILKIILNEIDYTLFSSKCAVFGYGKVGKEISDKLFCLGANVTVFARKKSDIALAQTKGLNAVNINERNDYLNDFNIIINTIPALIIDKNTLSNIDKKTLIIDVSSAPYGVDFNEAEKLGIKALLCPSLPGKTTPVTAGKILAEGVLNIMMEEGYE